MARASALAPQKGWAVNEPDELQRVLAKIDELRGSLSMADAIVLAGTAAVEKAAKDAGFGVEVPFLGGRGDASAEQTDARASSRWSPRPMASAITSVDQAFGKDGGNAAR